MLEDAEGMCSQGRFLDHLRFLDVFSICLVLAGFEGEWVIHGV